MQDRIGPNRVGPCGLFQPMADGIKILLKEDISPSHVDKGLFTIAPAISMFTTMLAFAVVPFGPVDQSPSWLRFIIAPNVDIGIVFIFAVTSLAVYGVILGGWASNNKYSALGSLRASAQVVSYEIPLGMSVLGVVLLSGTLNLEKILAQQAAGGIWGWNIWYQPLACLIFFTSSLAESNRLPFDLVGVRAGTRRRLPHRVRRLPIRDVLPRRVHAPRHDQLPDDHSVFRRLAFSLDRDGRERVHGRVAGEDLRAAHEGWYGDSADHADSLDDSAVSVRSVDGADVEGVHSAVAGEHGGRDDCAAVRLEPLVAVADFDGAVFAAGVLGVNAKRAEISRDRGGRRLLR